MKPKCHGKLDVYICEYEVCDWHRSCHEELSENIKKKYIIE